MLNAWVYMFCLRVQNVLLALMKFNKFADWGPLVDVVGYCFLNLGSKYQPQEDFVQWIQKGPPPLYFGFGSMVWQFHLSYESFLS